MRYFKQRAHLIWKLLTDDFTNIHRGDTWFVWGPNCDGKVATIVFDKDFLMKQEDGKYMTTARYYIDHPPPTVSG